MSRKPRICYAGTFERRYPRNWLTAEALREAGARVEFAHVPVLERLADKSAAGPARLIGIGLRLALAYGRLVPEVALRLLRCDGLVVGYIGQVDMLVLGPVAKLVRRPVIFDPLVTLTDTIVEDRRLVSARSPLAWVIKVIDRAALRLADVVVADTEENAQYLTERFGVPSERIVVEPVGADEVIFYENTRAEWPNATAGRPLDVLFYGKFIPLHGIETIIRAIRIVEERGIPARFELVGTGQTYRAMRGLAERLDIQIITWTDGIPYLALGQRLRAADGALGVFSGGAKAGRVVPNKVYQSLASRVATVTRESPAISGSCTSEPFAYDASPVILRRRMTGEASSGSDNSALLTDGESALLVPPDDPVALADAIERLCDGALRERIARGGFAAYKRHAGYKIRCAAMRSVLDRVICRS